jgi:preprotein translocase subunit YajC
MDFIPIILMVGVIYVMMIRPQIQEQEAHETLLKSLAKDDRVVTAAGVHGRIVKVEEHTVNLEVAKSTTIVIDKQSVVRRPSDKEKK